MPFNLKVVYTQGVPVVADFAATDGPPLCIDATTGRVYYLAAGDVVTAISAGTGTVTSVDLTVPTTLFTVSGTPITTAGTIAIALVSATGNLVLATPSSGATDKPTLRALTDADIPNALTISGGTVDNSVIGGTAPAAGTFTTVGGTTITATSTAKGATVYASATATFSNLVDISGASAGQIQFPASQNPSSNANTLDDYEEGTWTPAVSGTATYTTQTGIYCKIGRLVHASFYLMVNAIGTGNTTLVSGFPFTGNATNTKAGTVAYWTGSATALTWLGIYLLNSSTTTNFLGTAAAVNAVTNAVAFWANGADCLAAIDYQV